MERQSLDPSDIQKISIAFFFSNFLAFFMCVVIIGIYVSFSKVRKNPSSQIVILICVCESIMAFFRLLEMLYYYLSTGTNLEEYSKPLCEISGFFWNCLALTIYFQMVLIGFLLYIETRVSTAKKIEKYTKCIALLNFLLAVLVSLLPFLYGSYSKIDHLFCWITVGIMRLICFLIPFLISIFLYIFFIVAFIKCLNAKSTIKRSLGFKFLLFPLIIIVCELPGIVQRIYHLQTLELKIVVYFLSPLEGFLIPLLLVFINKQIKEKFIAVICCQWSRLKSSRSIEIEPLILGEKKQIIEIASASEDERMTLETLK